MKVRAEYDVWVQTPISVYLVDRSNGAMSVTNDAEAVVHELLIKFGNKKFFYRDSQLVWSQLLHDGVKFTGFGEDSDRVDFQ